MADDLNTAAPAAADASSTWSIDLNVAGVQAASAKFGGPQITKQGVQRVVIGASSRFISQKGFDTVKFECVIQGGEFDGYDQTVILPARPDAEKDPTGAKWKSRWKALMLNLTADPANLEKGGFKFGTATKNTPNGKNAYIYVRVPQEGELDRNGYQKRPEAAFMAPAEAAAELEAEKLLAARKAQTGTGAGAVAQSRAQPPATTAAAPKPNGTQVATTAIVAAVEDAGTDPLATI